jgi:mannose/fructose/N-acetylgalactosamine-specific phosphotransferase system component IIC
MSVNAYFAHGCFVIGFVVDCPKYVSIHGIAIFAVTLACIRDICVRIIPTGPANAVCVTV